MNVVYFIIIFKYYSILVKSEKVIKNPFFYVNDCNIESCNFPNLCFNKTICQCKKGFYDISSEIERCNYKQKSKDLIIRFENIISLGIGHILTGNIKRGFIKLFITIITFIFIYISVLSGYIKKRNITGNQLLISFITLILVILTFIFGVIDFFYMSSNSYLDGNEVPLI